MSAPLPQSLAAPQQRPSSAHTGLWFDKFCHQWTEAWRLDSPAKLTWIQTVTGSKIGDEKLLVEHVTRSTALARATGGAALHFKTTGRFATGLGREHPIENGFVWHPTLGVPCLPGSSVKGLVRAWASIWAEGDNQKAVQRIFGGEKSEHIGSVIFHNALPTKPLQLAADVMTPHYGPYYQDKEAPGDWHSPVPIPFLTVADGQPFLFTLSPRTPQDQADCQQATQWLTEALRELGAGAKTAVGYGRFVEYDPAKEIKPTGPRYKAGDRVTAQRVEDAKGKGRLWFQTDDGLGGVVTQGTPPQVEVGQSVELEIAAVMAGSGYNFRLPGTGPTPAKKHPQNYPRRR